MTLEECQKRQIATTLMTMNHPMSSKMNLMTLKIVWKKKIKPIRTAPIFGTTNIYFLISTSVIDNVKVDELGGKA